VSEVTTLVTPDMEERKGVWGGETTSYPISQSDIRKWAIAIYWGETPPRLFWDEEYAKTTKWGGIVAPEDFNPFAWTIRTTQMAPAGAQPGQKPEKGGNILNGGMVDTFGVRMRPGDVITARMRLSHWEEREGRHGLMLYSYSHLQWTNQNGEVVKDRMSTLIRY